MAWIDDKHWMFDWIEAAKSARNMKLAARIKNILHERATIRDDYRRARLNLELVRLKIFQKYDNDEVALFKDSHPVLLGSATLESLINQVPKTYDYVKNFHLPFDNLFFEFSESMPFDLPFGSGQHNAGGLWFYKGGPRMTVPYVAHLFYDEREPDERNMPLELKILFDPTNHARFDCILGARKIKIDMQTRAVHTEPYNWCSPFVSQDPGYLPQIPVEDIDLDEFPQKDLAVQISNLCTNIVNYINSHNVSVVERTRQAQETGPDRTIRKERRARPFYLITIKDAVVEGCPEEPGHTWTLKERIFVRGHDRRYLADDGSIKFTCWIRPYVKGPPHAPWREQRYQVLADKLEREQRLETI